MCEVEHMEAITYSADESISEKASNKNFYLHNHDEYEIYMFNIYRSEIDMYCALTTPKGYARTRFAITEIGHTVFLSREEAERKLNK